MDQQMSRLEKTSLKRILKASDLFGVGYGDLGSSIYYALGATALFALGATPLALLLAGFVFICTALTYAELASTFPESGGSATYTRYAFNDLISFIAGWGLLLDYIVTLSLSAFTVPAYLHHFGVFMGWTPTDSILNHIGWTVLILIFLFCLNFFGVKHSGRLTFALAALTVLSQLFVVIFGAIFLWNLPLVWDHLAIGVKNVSWSPTPFEFIKGVAMAMVAYTGIEAIAQLAGETKNPGYAIPKAIKYILLVLLVMYLGISTIGMSVMTGQELGTQYLEDPVAGIVSRFPMGQLFVPFLSLIAAIILLLAANAGLIGCSRLAFSMGEYYQIPSVFYKVHSRFQTPYVSLLIFTILGCLVVVASRGQMLFLADLYNIGAQIAFFSAHMALIFLRLKKPELPRPFCTPLNLSIGKGRKLPILAIIGAIANFAVFCVVVITKPEGRYAAIIWMFVGIISYFFYRRKKRLKVMGQVQVEKISLPTYVPMKPQKILVVISSLNELQPIEMACQLAIPNKAELIAVCIIEIHDAIPVDIPIQIREERCMAALKQAQAIAEEYHISVQLELIHSRTIEKAVNHVIKSKKIDLVVIGTTAQEFQSGSLGMEAKKVLFEAKCPVLFCRK